MKTANLSGAGLLGIERSRLTGRRFDLFVVVADRPAFADFLGKVFASEWNESCEVALLGKGNQPLFVQIEAVTVSSGQECRVAVIDITARRQIEAELKQTNMQKELILASAGEGIIGLDLDGNHTFVNASAAAMLGYEVNELVGKQSHSTWHYARPDGSRYPAEECPIYVAYRDGTVHSGEELFMRKDGTAFPVLFASRPIIIDGEITGAVLTFNDITARKQMEENLRESEELFRATFDQSAMGIGHVGPDGRILRLNRKYCDILGYAEEELKALTIQDITHPDDRKRSMDHFRQMLEGKLGSYSLEKRYVRKDGSTVWVNLTVSTVVDTGGNLKFAVGVVENISGRKQAEEEIERLNTDLAARAVDLEYTNRELETFNYTVAHDLRNPLNIVSSYCQALKELCSDSLDEQCQRYIKEIYNGALRMNRLIEALLQFSRLAHAELKREKVDLSRMAEEVAGEVKGGEHARRIEIRIAAGIVVDGDAPLLRIVLANLLGNAWKYTATQDEAIIEFGMTEVDDKPVLFVRDNGPGFDMKDADKLFAPFQRLPGAEECRGFGIGLATAERIIRRHGGRIWAEGEPNKGATFWFTFPQTEFKP